MGERDAKGRFVRGPGRRKGSRNRLPMEAREVIAETATELGGAQGLLDWVKRDEAHEALFWTRLYPRLLPYEVTGRDSGPVQIEVSMGGEAFPEPDAEGDG